MITYCHLYSTSADPIGDYCEHTDRKIDDRGLYETGDKCPKCGRLIEIFPY